MVIITIYSGLTQTIYKELPHGDPTWNVTWN